ncbi:MAG TPA: DUF4394 domain-containing protein [Nitrospiraceae bacterium]|nr:DUF4394 domain-containing protein [Nitrospiraceae bacterium]
MRYIFTAILTASVLFAGVLPSAIAESIYALTVSHRLVSFDSATPGTLTSDFTISGLQNGEALHGIDFRPANSQLYGVSNLNNLYTLNTSSGAASLASSLSTPLNGTAFGVDFNPVVDRLRITSNTAQNLRVNVDTGAAIVDGTLAYAAGDPRFGQNPTIVGSAYSNNVAGATSTTLRDIDSNFDILVVQNPANAGTLTSAGSLGVNTSDLVGYDVSGVTGTPYVSLTAPGAGSSQLYTLNANGSASLVGTIGAGTTIVGLSAAPVSAVPEPATILLIGTGLAGIAAVACRRAKISAREAISN